MNAIALFLLLVLNGNMTCGAEVPSETLLGEQTVRFKYTIVIGANRNTLLTNLL
jgi:hypothetical protein